MVTGLDKITDGNEQIKNTVKLNFKSDFININEKSFLKFSYYWETVTQQVIIFASI
tara:strand:- start:289 stop:456 length:168 start_codon:yes stop_codon:yes gene_type:complete